MVTSTPALFVAATPGTSADTLFFGTQSSLGPNFFALQNLYGGSPTTAWSATLGGNGLENSWVEFDAANNVYVEDTTGTLWCFSQTGGLCSGWVHSKYPSTGSAIGSQYASPWWSFDENAVYFADSSGQLYKVSTATGSLVWSVNLQSVVVPTNSMNTATDCPGGCNTFAIRSSPVEYNGHIYVGNDGGVLYNITDPGTRAPGAANVKATWLCGNPVGSGGCNSASQTVWSVLNAVSIDVTASLLYAAASGTVFEFQLNPTSWLPQNQLTFFSGATYPVYSSPILDRGDGLLYVSYSNTLYKVTYPLVAGGVSSVALQGQGANASYPHGSPLPWAGNIYVGDGAGELEQYACLAQPNPQPPQLTGVTSAYGTTIDSTPISNYSESAINVGFSNGSGAGGVAQIAYTGAFACPGGGSCTSSTASCGGALVCTHGGGCCSATDCPTAPATGSYACTNGTCVESCNPGYNLCNTQCIPTGWCCSNSDCTSPNTCSPTTGQCIAPIDTVTLNLNYPVNATLTNISGNATSPENKLSTGTVTVTNGSTTVLGSGTSFTTSYTTSIGVVSLTNGGIGCTSAPTIAFSGGGGSGAAATATVTNGSVSAISIGAAGSGYTGAPTVTFSGGGCTTLPVAVASIGATGTAAAGTVTSVVLTQNGPGGAGYTSTPTVTFQSGICTTTAPTATATVSLTQVATVNVTNGGSGYTSAPTVTFAGGCSTEPVATAAINTGTKKISSVTVTTPGSGCTSAPMVGFSGGGGTSGAATAILSGSVTAITLTNGGAGCTASPTVTITGGGATTTATATAETGLSFSIDGSTWYEIASVGSAAAQTLTLRSPYNGTTETALATYYETDCNAAAQSCNQTYPFTIANLSGVPTCTGAATCPSSPPTCNAVTCSTSVTLFTSAGAFSFSAVGYDSQNRREASAILNNGLNVTTPTTTTAYLNMIRSYPIGTGNATCPLNMAEDSNGNIWTVNGNGNSGSTCPGPTNNLSVLVKSATPPYAPTVINSPAITSSPEWITADNSGDVWVTVPGVENGVFEFSSTTSTTPRTQYTAGSANCIIPRGIDIDPNTAPNGVFVACAGNSNAGEGGRYVIRMDGNGNQTTFYDFMDYTAQPVSLIYPRSYTPGSGILTNTDYHGNYEVYVNRSSATEVVITAVEWDPVTLSFYDPCTSATALDNTYQLAQGLNPFGLSYDSGGTPYAVARAGTGDVINVEFTGNITQPNQNTCGANGSNDAANTMNQDSLNPIAGPAPWGTANDDLYTYLPPGGLVNSQPLLLAGTTFFTSHNTTGRVTRFADGQAGPLNDYIVGATSSPGPEGLLFDRQQGVIWVADALEASLTQINKNLFVFGAEANVGAYGAKASTGACIGTAAPGASVNVTGFGFDTSIANGSNNTVLLAGYMATTTSVTTGSYDGVGTLTVTAGGSGYTTAPTVTLTGGSCTTEPTATATISGTLTATVQSGGANYTSTPTVTFSGGSAAPEATGVSSESGGTVSGVMLTTGGANYSSAPTVTFTGGCTTEPTAVATITPTTVVVPVTFGGTGYSSPTVTFSGGCTTEPTATANLSTGVTSVMVTAGGSGYTAATVTFSGGGCTTEPTGTVTLSGGAVTAVNLTGEGAGCTSAPTLAFASTSGGTGAAATATISSGVIGSVTVNTDGSGCTSAPMVSFTDSSGSGATATATLSGGVVTALTLETAGSGCVGAPWVTLSGGGTTPTPLQASVVATESGGVVTALNLTTGGFNVTVPTVAFSGGGATTQATATATLATSAPYVDVTTLGAGYTATPTVTFSGGGCTTEPVGVAQMSGGSVLSITLTNPGAGCTSAPAIAFANITHTTAAVAKAFLPVASVTMTPAGGVGYTSAPAVAFIGGCAIEPIATSTISGGGQVTAINVLTQAQGCTGVPEITLVGGGFTKQAAASAALSGSVSGGWSGTVNVNDACATPPTVSFTGGGGSGAAATLTFVDPPPTTLTVTVPNAPHGITGPITVSNQGGQVVSYCTYTTR
jgi:hypothetical protein